MIEIPTIQTAPQIEHYLYWYKEIKTCTHWEKYASVFALPYFLKL